ncbi:hypothetical protein BgiBS90_031065 [Biomphalaria glabrata]|nr:hypothetical protein BgiBS90_031065 [Biomphalaria glabrata]
MGLVMGRELIHETQDIKAAVAGPVLAVHECVNERTLSNGFLKTATSSFDGHSITEENDRLLLDQADQIWRSGEPERPDVDKQARDKNSDGDLTCAGQYLEGSVNISDNV